jgi:Ig-fold domain
VMYSDNYFDLLPGEARTINLEMFLPPQAGKHLEGRLYIEGSNVPVQFLSVILDGP